MNVHKAKNKYDVYLLNYMQKTKQKQELFARKKNAPFK